MSHMIIVNTNNTRTLEHFATYSSLHDDKDVVRSIKSAGFLDWQVVPKAVDSMISLAQNSSPFI